MSGLALQPIRHTEGIALLKAKPAVTRSVFDQLLPELKGLAYTITGIEAVDVLQRSRDLIAGLPQGRTWETVKEDLLAEISPWLISGDDDEELAKSARAAERRAELLMRLHGFNAYEVAHSRVMEEMGDIFSHWRWQTMGDERVRASHAAMDGITLPKDSPFWRTTWPRRGYFCRCQLIGITPEEAEKEIVKDRKLDPEKRKYLEGLQLVQLEQGGLINRGPSEQYNLAKEAATGPHRQFGTLRVDPDELKSRYDADVWAEFEAFAKAQEIEPGRTVWGWMTGLDNALPPAPPVPGPLPLPLPVPAPVPAPLPPAPPVPAPLPVTTPAPTPTAVQSGAVALGTPVGDAMAIDALVKSQQKLVAEVMAAIGEVHGDGVLPLADLGHACGSAKTMGLFSPVGSRQNPIGPRDRIRYRRGDTGKIKNRHPEMTLAHEVGHFLDLRALPGAGYSSKRRAAALDDWWQAVQSSQHYQDLVNPNATFAHKWRRYASTREELWARAYAQFIATESTHAGMKAQLAQDQAEFHGNEFRSQWLDDDFEPVRAAMTRLFESLGWRAPQP